ncbi:hypothetical protein [Methanosarcina barkeri]|uniref:hypothetical protein n=1 Tax=Methanosarcina barkeri TaxID=2208 RepID=UPI000A86F20A|nr:hypothetical protein [Methanosarcina barkeri]
MIQEAVNNAHEGDRILVSPGAYRENIIVNRELTIFSHPCSQAARITVLIL